MTMEEAFNAVDACFKSAFGDAGNKIVVESFLEGEEASFSAFVMVKLLYLLDLLKITNVSVMVILEQIPAAWELIHQLPS